MPYEFKKYMADESSAPGPEHTNRALPSHVSPVPKEALHRSIVCGFRFLREIAGGELPSTPVICDALAAFSLPAAGIRAGTRSDVGLHAAFHETGKRPSSFLSFHPLRTFNVILLF